RVVGDLEDSLESNMAYAVTEPIVGWVCAFLGGGLGGGDDSAPLPEAILQKLQDIQGDFSTLLSAVNQLGPQIGNFVSLASAVDRMQPALSAVQSYELTGNLLADTFTTNLDYLNTVHDALITGTAYLTTFLNSNVSYYADNSPVQQMINGFFLYYQNL